MATTMPTAASTGAERRGEPGPDAIRDQVERIRASSDFRGSPRRRALLQFLVEETLAGRGDRLKGYNVALAVFGRQPGFDAAADPVVRLEARRLRRDLDSYYAGTGANDPLRIAIPKGAYVPTFEWRREAGNPEPLPAAGAPLAPLADDAPADGPPPGAFVPEGDRRLRRFWLAAVALMALLAVLGGVWAGLRDTSPGDEAAARGPGVIVLPFAALSSGEDDRFLAAGMTQELIAKLMRFPDFRLFSSPASFAQSPTADPVDLGRRLGFAYVVQGSIRSELAQVHVGAMLTDATTGHVLWSGTYERPLTPGDIFVVQEEISAEIATTLGQTYGVLSGQETARLARGAIPSMSSYACVLRAHAYRRAFDEALYAPVRGCLEAAVARDPSYADAWAMLAWLHLDAGRFGIAPEGPDEAYALALETATRAVAVDPQSTLALKALGSIHHYAGRFDESVQVMHKALETNPNDPDAMAQLGWRLAVRGNFAEGIPYLKRAIARTINPPGWYFHLVAVNDYLEGDYAAMLADAERSAVDGSEMSQSFIAIAQGALGHAEDARRALDRLAAMSPEFLRDPAAAYRVHQPAESIVQALLAGLRKAGWSEHTAATRP